MDKKMDNWKKERTFMLDSAKKEKKFS